MPPLSSNEPKYQRLAHRLRALVAESPVGTKLPSYTSLMRDYGVGQVTIDRAMQALDEDGLIERQPGRGIFVSERAKERTVGLVFGRNIFAAGASPVYGQLIDIADRVARQQNEHVSFFLDLPNYYVADRDMHIHRDLYEALVAKRLDGIVLACPREPQEMEWLTTFGLPVVAMTSNPNCRYRVHIDLCALTALAVDTLVARGCRRPALIALGGSLRPYGLVDDLDGFRGALERHDIAPVESLIWDEHDPPPDAVDLDFATNEEYGYRAILDLLRREDCKPAQPPPFDSIVSTDDMATRGALVALRENGLRVPDDVLIATHTNRGSPILSNRGDLIRIEFDPAEYAGRAFDLLWELMAGRQPAEPSLVIQPTLIVPNLEDTST